MTVLGWGDSTCALFAERLLSPSILDASTHFFFKTDALEKGMG